MYLKIIGVSNQLSNYAWLYTFFLLRKNKQTKKQGEKKGCNKIGWLKIKAVRQNFHELKEIQNNGLAVLNFIYDDFVYCG